VKPNDAQCNALLDKHGVRFSDKDKPVIIAIIKEAYRAGMNADVMRIASKKEENQK